MFDGARRLLRQLAEKILDIDDTTQPTAHIKYFEEYLGKHSFDTSTTDVTKFLGTLKHKHLVDEIVVSSLNGSAIASTNGNSVTQAVTGAALFNYVKTEIPKGEAILIRANGSGNNWHMIFQLNRKLYIVKASSDLSTIELRALAREIDSFISKNGAN